MDELALSPYNPKLDIGDVIVYDSTCATGSRHQA